MMGVHQPLKRAVDWYVYCNPTLVFVRQSLYQVKWAIQTIQTCLHKYDFSSICFSLFLSYFEKLKMTVGKYYSTYLWKCPFDRGIIPLWFMDNVVSSSHTFTPNIDCIRMCSTNGLLCLHLFYMFFIKHRPTLIFHIFVCVCFFFLWCIQFVTA